MYLQKIDQKWLTLYSKLNCADPQTWRHRFHSRSRNLRGKPCPSSPKLRCRRWSSFGRLKRERILKMIWTACQTPKTALVCGTPPTQQDNLIWHNLQSARSFSASNKHSTRSNLQARIGLIFKKCEKDKKIRTQKVAQETPQPLKFQSNHEPFKQPPKFIAHKTDE